MNQKIDPYSDTFEKMIIGKSIAGIEKMLDLPLESQCNDEYVFILQSAFFGLFRKRLHLYCRNGLVSDYFIGW